jgi:hypothetical protein
VQRAHQKGNLTGLMNGSGHVIMTNRIIFAYLGAIGIPLLLLPVAAIYTMGGHSLMYITIISSPIGLIAGLCYSDVKRKYQFKAIVIRSIASIIVFIILLALIALSSEAEISTFLKIHGWVLIPLTTPLITAIASNKILESLILKKGGRNT